MVSHSYFRLGENMVVNDNSIWNRLAADIEMAVDEACEQLRNMPIQTIPVRIDHSA